MPPSGPSALWSSNNSVQLNAASLDNSGGNHGNNIAMMNNSQKHDVIGSLGKVLSSVNLEADGSGHSRGGGGGGGQGGHHHHQGGYGAAVGSQPGSWSGLSGPAAAPAPAGLSYNFYPNSNGGNGQPPNAVKNGNGNNNAEHDSLQNILYDSGIYEKEEVAHRRASTGHGGSSGPPTGTHTPSTPLSGSDRERKPSIDIFLSQSPSKTLGEDAFRGIMHRTASNPSLANNVIPGQQQQQQHDYGAAGNGGGSGSGLKRMASTAPSSRSESPQTIRSGGVASSGGGSPYAGNRHQAMYPSQFANGGATNNNTFSPQGGNQQQQQGLMHTQLQQQPSISSQFSNSSSGNQIQGLVNGGGHQQQHQQHQHQNQQYIPMPVASQQQQQQQPQVFYMAVPAPDGKGQVLQPVQMVQMPGQPGALMMPVQAAQGGNQVGSNGDQQGQAQQMMLMQPLQAGNGGMANGMYSQDGGQGNGNNSSQYSQYGNAYGNQNNPGGGYDHNNRYQSKNNSMDNNNYNLGGQTYHTNDLQGAVGNNNGNNLDQVPAGSLSMLYSSPQRPPLRALLGNVRRLSRDQVGCRLLQQALDEDGPTAATAILDEGLTFWAEAMVDPFGNYLFQKILERITPEERVTLVGSVSTRLVNASLNLHGTRSVQKIVEVCAADEEESEEEEDGNGNPSEETKKEDDEEEGDKSSSKNKNGKKKNKKKDTAAGILTDALKPSAARLCIDSHGNHAIQRILLKLPYRYTQFIFDAVAASVEDVARHRHGCCVIQRCLDSRHSAARTHLVGRIVEKSLELMQDAYGNYVVQYVLDVCGDDEVHAICESVIGKVCPLAVQKFSSNVMEKCLERCTDRVREEYLDELNDGDRIRELMMDPFGNYVVQRALSVSTHAQAIRLVETMKPHLSSQNGGGIRNTAGGRRILGKICRRFPNFVLEGETFEDYDLNQVLARGHSPHHHHHQGGGGGGRGGRQNQYGGYPHPGPSPNHRRGRGRGQHGQGQHQHHQHIPQYQQPQPVQPPVGQQAQVVQHGAVGHHLNVQQSDMNVMQPNAYNPYLFPHSM